MGCFDEFDQRIAQPIGMQDFRVADQRYRDGPDSVHPSYMFYLSACDLARFGLLYLRCGAWCGHRIIPEEWVGDSTRVHARTPVGPGFGYLWWAEDEGCLFGRLILPPGSYASYGFGGQFLVVIPALDLVVVHLCHQEDPRSREGAPTLDELSQLLTMILAAQPPS
jgi:CubicO group peptidase (beta-lactamase class C family)